MPYMYAIYGLEEELEAENARLREELRGKVWTMALATVSEMEKIAGGATHTENVTLPNRASEIKPSKAPFWSISPRL